MRGNEILKLLKEKRTGHHQFVKWWRIEDDFLDYDLIDRFVENLTGSVEMGGIDLLTLDEMWSVLQRIAGDRVTRQHETSGDKVVWVHQGKSGVQTQVCAFTPETVMTIFDVESKGNPVGQ